MRQHKELNETFGLDADTSIDMAHADNQTKFLELFSTIDVNDADGVALEELLLYFGVKETSPLTLALALILTLTSSTISKEIFVGYDDNSRLTTRTAEEKRAAEEEHNC